MMELLNTTSLEMLLNRYETMGGIVEYVVIERGIHSPEEIATHRQAALRTLEILGERQYQHSGLFRVEVHPEFLGPYFDLDTRRLILRGIQTDI